MKRGTMRTTGILSFAGMSATVLLAGAVTVGMAGGEQTPELDPVEVSLTPSESPEPSSPFPGPLAVGVELEEDTTHAECVRLADYYGLGDVEATGELTVHNGEYIWTYPSWTCWVNVDGELFLTPVETY